MAGTGPIALDSKFQEKKLPALKVATSREFDTVQAAAIYWYLSYHNNNNALFVEYEKMLPAVKAITSREFNIVLAVP
jgi:hypothetical protein